MILDGMLRPFLHTALGTVVIDTENNRAFNTSFVSKDRWFEVDGAEAARDFIRNSTHSSEWDEHRVQLVWDAIALHTNADIAKFKQPEVQYTSAGTILELVGPDVARQQWVRNFFFLPTLRLSRHSSNSHQGRFHHCQSNRMGNDSGRFSQIRFWELLSWNFGSFVSGQANDYV